MTRFDDLVAEFRTHADANKAADMKRYMRDQFDYFGIPTPLRRSLAKPLFRELKQADTVDWGFVDSCWAADYRELQYVATDYLRMVSHRLGPGDLSHLQRLAQTKSWWDTIDALDQVVGTIAEHAPEVDEILLEWSTDDDFWLRRIAIDHQLMRKERTDTALLERIIVNNLDETEFFITKAIGWALRQYSKTDPAWVGAFIERYRHRLAALSIREASKYL